MRAQGTIDSHQWQRDSILKNKGTCLTQLTYSGYLKEGWQDEQCRMTAFSLLDSLCKETSTYSLIRHSKIHYIVKGILQETHQNNSGTLYSSSSLGTINPKCKELLEALDLTLGLVNYADYDTRQLLHLISRLHPYSK